MTDPAVEQRRLRRTWPQRLLITFNLLMVAGCLIAASGLEYVENRTSRLQRVALGHVLSESTASGVDADGDPQTILVVGIDSAENLDEDDPVRSGRSNVGLLSDTIMLVRVDPTDGRASLLSVPRDLWVPIAGMPRRQRVNAALSTGGPDVLVQTITTYFNVEIDHYVQLDFAGFKGLVEAVDGVPVYFDRPARDVRSGLVVENPGCVVLSPGQSLAYARSRAFEYFEDGRWRIDGTADLGRITRQQDFIKRALGRAMAKGVRNPITLNQLVSVGLSSVTVDERFTARDVARLATQFRSFEPDDLETFTLPVDPADKAGQAVLELREDEAQSVLNVFRGIEGSAVVPSIVRVRVLNGSGALGESADAAGELAGIGFDVVGSGDAGSFEFDTTVIRHGVAQRTAATLLARWLDGPIALQEDESMVGGVIDLVTGRSFAGVRSTEANPSLQLAQATVPSTLAAVDVPAVDVAEDAPAGTAPPQTTAAPEETTSTSETTSTQETETETTAAVTVVSPETSAVVSDAEPATTVPVGVLPGDEESRRACTA